MKEFKIGGKITLEDNNSYRILDIIEYKGKKYLFCCTEIKPIRPQVLVCKEINDEIYVSVEGNPKILLEISKLVINNKN